MKQFPSSLPIRSAILAGLMLLSLGFCLAGGCRSTPQPDLTASAQAEVALPQTQQSDRTGQPEEIQLRSCDGMVCVYRDGVLSQRTDISIAALPARDRADLDAGITVEDEQALHRLLEDLGS